MIVNAIQAKTGIQNILYNPKVLVSQEEAFQTQALRDLSSVNDADWTSTFGIGGNSASEQSSVVFAGGNLRCFLKLAGTPYWPELENKVLVLESAGGRYEAMCSGLAQLEQLGAFEKNQRYAHRAIHANRVGWKKGRFSGCVQGLRFAVRVPGVGNCIHRT